MWVRKIFKERQEKGEYHILVKDLQLFDAEYFFKTFRMTVAKFEELLAWVGPSIQKSSRLRVDVPSPAERLCVTLRYLASGDAQVSIALSYRISPTTVGRIIRETCEALWSVLQAKGFLKVPNEQNTWKEISHRFGEMWNFPHCIGAIDGKHVVMQAPANSGSEWFNYIKTHSIVLLAICTADYEFTLVDIGDAGRQSDGGVYSHSKLGYAIGNNTIDIPPPEPIPTYNASKSFPYILLSS